ncbi:MAG: Uma2 family endonuclease [Myxococcota bacterium]
MSEPARKAATYEDVLAAPSHMVAEILGGELVLTPRPGPRHARTGSKLGVSLGPFDVDGEGPGGWWILDEPELHLEAVGRPVVPDLAGWRVERLPELPDTAYFTLAPDWICEVISPGTEAVDRAEKMPLYAASGVKHAWLVDPVVETLEVFRLEDARWSLVTTLRGAATAHVEPFDALPLALGPLWRRKA